MSPFCQRAYLPVALLFLLSLLEAATVLTRDLLPSLELAALPPMQHSAMTLACFGLIAAATAILRRDPSPSFPALRGAALTGLTLFAAPLCLAAIATRYIPPLTVAAFETLAPLFCVILNPYLGAYPGEAQEPPQPRYGILPALAAFAGVLLIFPVFVPSTYAAALAIAAALLAAFSLGAGNCLAVRTAAEHPSLAVTAATASLSAAFTLGLLSFLLERPRLRLAMFNLPTITLFLSELIALALLFWLTRRLSAPPLSTRILWTLLIPIFIEAAALPVPLSTRSWIGLALMASGSALLLLPPKRSSALRGLTLH